MYIVISRITGRINLAGERPDILTIAADIHRQKVNQVHTLLCQIVERSYDSPAASIAPIGVARLPITNMCRICLNAKTAARTRIVETAVSQEILRAVGAAFDPVWSIPKFKIMPAGVLEPAETIEFRRIGGAFTYFQSAANAIEVGCPSGMALKINSNVLAFPKRGDVFPLAGLLRSKSNLPCSP